MGESFEHLAPDAVVAGTVGLPGQRVFYLQFRSGSAITSLKMEKQQVGALAEYLRSMLADLPQPDSVPHPDSLRLAEPVEAAWAVGTIGLAFDLDLDRLVLVVEEVLEADEEGDPLPASVAEQGRLTARLTRGQAGGLVVQGQSLVAAGRPACPWCGRPINPDGHICPRTNGHGVH